MIIQRISSRIAWGEPPLSSRSPAGTETAFVEKGRVKGGRTVRSAPQLRGLLYLTVLLNESAALSADFSKVTVPGLPPVASMASGSLAWGDYDNDNLLDFLITGSTTTQLWRNTGAGFTRVTVPGLAGVGEGAVAWGDYNQDGRLDFLITGMNGSGSTITQLWRNTGSGFVQTPVSGLQGVWLGDVAWTDFDKDGDLDFVVTGTRSFSSGPRLTQLWRNTGTGFTRVSTPGWVGLEMSSVAWGDFGNDGRLDFIITGESAAGKVTQVWRNTGSTFEPVEIPRFAGNFGDTVEWADYNNDGWLDFLVSGGETQATTQLWRNASGSFALDPSDNVSHVGVPSLAWGDYDRDGRLDYLITGFNGSLEPADQYFSELWRNVGGVRNSPPSPLRDSAFRRTPGSPHSSGSPQRTITPP